MTNMRHLRSIAGMLTLVLVTAGADCLRAAGPADAIPMPTMGGKQFWADELFFHQWRIQQNVLTGHYRLLDEKNFRHASGTLRRVPGRAGADQTAAESAAHAGQGGHRAARPGADRSHMDRLAKYLRDHGGYTVFNVTYPEHAVRHRRQRQGAGAHHRPPRRHRRRSTSSPTAWATSWSAATWATRPTRPAGGGPTGGSSGS